MRVLKTFNPEILPDTTTEMRLGGRTYRIRMRWNSRISAWVADLYTQMGQKLQLNQLVSTGTPLFRTLRGHWRFGGVLVALSRDVQDPDLYSFSSGRSWLAWYDKEEARAIIPEPQEEIMHISDSSPGSLVI